jgi:hypothetical protein
MMKKYRFAWWRLQHWPLIILAVITLYQAVRSLVNPGVELVPLWLRIAVVVGGLLMLGILIWGVAQFFLSYLVMSDEGIGERRWPGKPKVVSWDKVEFLRNYTSLFIFKNDILVYKEMRQLPGNEQKEELNFFTLSDFKGWPKGPLADDLRRRLPQVFKK